MSNNTPKTSPILPALSYSCCKSPPVAAQGIKQDLLDQMPDLHFSVLGPKARRSNVNTGIHFCRDRNLPRFGIDTQPSSAPCLPPGEPGGGTHLLPCAHKSTEGFVPVRGICTAGIVLITVFFVIGLIVAPAPPLARALCAVGLKKLAPHEANK